jgi:hypothetical protein
MSKLDQSMSYGSYLVWLGLMKTKYFRIFGEFLAILFENIKIFRENMKMIVFFHLIHKKDKNSLVNRNVKFEMEKIKFRKSKHIFANNSAIFC